MHTNTLSLDTMVDVLKAVAEPSRLRILTLLCGGDLTVSDLTSILNQSQPRVSRHLKLLSDAGLITRYQEGSWAYFSVTQSVVRASILQSLMGWQDMADPLLVRDQERLAQVKAERHERAAAYFTANAQSWDEIRSLHVSDMAVEKKLIDIIGEQPFQTMLDIGTGTGRLLELFAPLYVRGLGVDINREMLTVARNNLDRNGVSSAQVRQGDIYALPVDRGSCDLITIHQVLHFLEDPQAAIKEAARCLRPQGRLLIVDFAPHELEFLREEHAHLRLGFGDEQMSAWLIGAGLEVEKTEALPRQSNIIESNQNGLIVKLWLARDPRRLLADDVSVQIS